ncbi:hypothetical protein FHT12_002656 [Xanthomonas campestris]|nr:hypothetical protein [Xanthomonas euroxanthea]
MPHPRGCRCLLRAFAQRRHPRFIPPVAVQTAGPAPGMPHPRGCRRAPLTQGGLHSGAMLERRVVRHRWNCCRWNCLVMTAAFCSGLRRGMAGPDLFAFHRLRGKVPEGRMGAARECVADPTLIRRIALLLPRAGEGERCGLLPPGLREEEERSRRALPSTACGGGCPKGGWGQRGNAWRIPPSSGAARHLLPQAGEGERCGLLPPGLREAEERSRRSLPSTACGGRCPKGGWGRRGDGVPIPSSGAVRHLLPQAGEGVLGDLHLPGLRERCVGQALCFLPHRPATQCRCL